MWNTIRLKFKGTKGNEVIVADPFFLPICIVTMLQGTANCTLMARCLSFYHTVFPAQRNVVIQTVLPDIRAMTAKSNQSCICFLTYNFWCSIITIRECLSNGLDYQIPKCNGQIPLSSVSACKDLAAGVCHMGPLKQFIPRSGSGCVLYNDSWRSVGLPQ